MNGLRGCDMTEFKLKHGVIPACDVTTLDELKRLMGATTDVEGIVAYKCGKRLVTNYGLPAVVDAVSTSTDLPMILDVQKEGNDVEFTEPDFIGDYARAGVKMLILFPFAGPRVQATCIKACYDNGITPIGGFRLTQKGWDETEEVEISDILLDIGGTKVRGYIAEDAEVRALQLYAATGVTHFIGPGNKPDELRRQKEILQEAGVNPVFAMPGFKRQGGEIATTFEMVRDCAGAYAIIGSGIYKAPDITEAARVFCGEALGFE